MKKKIEIQYENNVKKQEKIGKQQEKNIKKIEIQYQNNVKKQENNMKKNTKTI